MTLSEPKIKSSLTQLTAIFTGGNIISLVLSLSAGLLVARFSNPEDLGLLNSISLVLGYAIFLQAGILNGLNRQLPYFIGKGMRDEAKLYASAAQAWSIFIGGLVGITMFFISGWFFFQKDLNRAAGYLVIAFSSFTLFFVSNYLQVTFRTRGDFIQLARINVIKNVFSLASVLFVNFFGFFGLCIRVLIIETVNLFLHWRFRPIRVKPIWNTRRLFDLLKIGAPIFASGQLYSWWIVLNSTLVLANFQTRGLGLYQLAIISASAIEILYSSLGQIIYPRMAETFGKEESVQELVYMSIKPIIFIFFISIIIITTGWFLLPAVVPLILPKYTEAIPAAQWLLLATAPLSFQPINNLFAVVKRVDLYVISLISGIGVYILVLNILLNEQPSLTVFPQALLVGRLVMIGLSLFFISFLQKKSRKNITHINK